MGKKMNLISSLFRNKDLCKHPRTLSFRDDMFKTFNSVFVDPSMEYEVDMPESWFTSSFECASFSTDSEDYEGESLEMVVHEVRRSERLFFEPGSTSSILEEAKTNGFPFKESEVLAMESEDPCGDFERSLEHMVQSHGLKD